MAETRFLTVSERVSTKFGTLYVHVCRDGLGRIVEVSFSSPGKFSDTAVGDALDELAEAVNDIIAIDTP